MCTLLRKYISQAVLCSVVQEKKTAPLTCLNFPAFPAGEQGSNESLGCRNVRSYYLPIYNERLWKIPAGGFYSVSRPSLPRPEFQSKVTRLMFSFAITEIYRFLLLNFCYCPFFYSVTSEQRFISHVR